MRRGAAGLFAGAVALAGCTGGGSAKAIRATAGSAVAETSTSTGVSLSSSTTSRQGAGTTATTARATTATTPAPAAAAPTGPKALAPPAPGTYRYDTDGVTTFAANTIPFPAVTTLVVDPPAGTHQHSTRDIRDPSGNGTVTELTLDYRPQGVYLVTLKLTTSIGVAGDSRTFQPPSPVLLLPTGARPGAHHEANLATPTTAARLVVDVLREERLTVAGQAVDTLVMRAAVTLPPGDLSGRQELTVWIDQASRLWVKEHSVADASAAGGLFKLHSEYNATIQRLTP